MTAVGTTSTTWSVDTDRSTAAFSVGNLGVRQVRGTVPVRSGTVTTDGDGRVLAVAAVLDAAGVDTANDRRDRDLRSPRLLDVDQAPTWSFAAGPAEQDGDGWRVSGVLTVRRPCDVVLSVAPVVPLPDGGLRVRATTRLDRRDAGVHAPRVLVGRQVEVELDVVLVAEPVTLSRPGDLPGASAAGGADARRALTVRAGRGRTSCPRPWRRGS